MVCLKPIRLEKLGFEIPCGKCIKCRIARTSEWCIRIEHECIDKPSFFLTLTFSDEYVPEEINKVQLGNFLRRLKRMLGETKIKYFACGEYGSISGRPHYHAIIIGWKPDFEKLKKAPSGGLYSEELAEIWKYGFHYIGSTTKDSIQYVTGYVRKKIYSNKHFSSRQEAFQIQSMGIGKNYAIENADMLLKRGCRRGGFNIGLP